MKATFVAKFPGTITRSHRKERAAGFSRALIAVVPDDTQVCRNIAEARLYWSGSFETAYCCLWVHGDTWTAGSGKAGGYGYHKESAAMAEAIRNAGFKLDSDIDGRGLEAMKDALTAIAHTIAGDSVPVQIINTHP